MPKKKIKTRERVADPATGKVTARLKFEEVDKKKPPSKLAHTVQDAPGNTVLLAFHREISKSEDENVGVESAHKLEEAAETGGHIVRSGTRSHKLKPYRKAVVAEHRLEKANISALYHKSLRENPRSTSNPLSRWQQKQAIKKQYTAMKSAGQTTAGSAKTAGNTARAAKKAAKRSEQAASFFWRNKKEVLVVILLFLIVCLLGSALSSCAILMEGGLSVLGSSTYPSQDGDMLGVEAAYTEMETNLQHKLDTYEDTHSYDEYHYDLDEIKHDPYVLVSLLTAYHQGGWTLEQVRGTLQMLFDMQYTLTEWVEVETHYDSDDEPYDWYVCYVTLKNFDLSHLPVYVLDEEKLNLYAVYMATFGNRPDLFPAGEFPNASQREEYTDFEVPPEALEDESFAAMLNEAEKYLGYPYVWGGSNPGTSFDCSGYISWILNHSGWNVGRQSANGLLNVCTPVSSANARPGDLIFFQGTYDTAGASHVGLYVGGGMMIHCGSPISYANINTSYWQGHFLTYGRLP